MDLSVGLSRKYAVPIPSNPPEAPDEMISSEIKKTDTEETIPDKRKTVKKRFAPTFLSYKDKIANNDKLLNK